MLMVVTAMKVSEDHAAASDRFILLTETAGSTEMCVLFYQNTRHHITEDGSLQRMNIMPLLLQCVYDLY